MNPTDATPDSAKYWAAKPIAELAPELDKKIDQYYEWVRHTRQLDLWIRMLRMYYAGSYDQGMMGTAGEQDEYTTIKVNHLHQVGEAIVTIVTGSRPSFEPHATNSDSASAKQTIIANSLLEYAMKTKDLEGEWIDAVRYAMQLRHSWLLTAWDPAAGKPIAVDPMTGRPVQAGDIVYSAYMPSDVVTDVSKDDPDSNIWLGHRDWVNKFDLIAKYPELASRLAGVATKSYDIQGKRPRLVPPWRSWRFDSDDVAVWTWYHAKTPAMPQGRKVIMIDGTLWLFDGPLPYEEIPLIRLASEDQTGTQLGYSTLLDCMPLQQAVSSLNSVTISNLSTFGAGNVWTKTGEPLSVEDLAGGLKHLQSNTKPEPVDLVSVNEAIPAMESHLVNGIEILSGVNPVARGSAEALEKGLSGSAYALFDAKSIQFLNGTQRAAVRGLEFAADMTVSHFRTYGKAPIVLEMVGKSRQSYMQDFIGTRDLTSIQRVTVDIGSPLTRTTAGRMNLAEMLMKLPEGGGIRTPAEIEQVLATGRIEPLLEGTEKELVYIREENEALADGNPVRVAISDLHPTHIAEHKAVMASIEARSNPAVVHAWTTHMQAHAMNWRTADPAITGIPPPPPPPMLGPPPGAHPALQPHPGAPGGAPHGPPHGGPGGKPPGISGPPPSLGGPSPEPNMPAMPVNPQGGGRAPLPEGA